LSNVLSENASSKDPKLPSDQISGNAEFDVGGRPDSELQRAGAFGAADHDVSSQLPGFIAAVWLSVMCYLAFALSIVLLAISQFIPDYLGQAIRRLCFRT
jgi:hypothetical protein